MKPCSFYVDQNQAASYVGCSVHGQSPTKCADELRKELEASQRERRELLQSIEIRERDAGELKFQLKQANLQIERLTMERNSLHEQHMTIEADYAKLRDQMKEPDRLNGVYRTALEKIKERMHAGPVGTNWTAKDANFMWEAAVAALTEKPNHDHERGVCDPQCQKCRDYEKQESEKRIKPVPMPTCHPEGRGKECPNCEPAVKQTPKQERCHETVRWDGGPIYCYEPMPCKVHAGASQPPPSADICHKCGHKNTAGNVRILYTSGGVSVCGFCLTTTR